MAKRENSSMILQNLRKRDLPQLGQPVVPVDEAERIITSSADPSMVPEKDVEVAYGDTYHDSGQASMHDSSPDSMIERKPEFQPVTRLKPRERAARSALIVRLNPTLHRRLEAVARYNRLTMNDIATEAIELHLRNFPQPSDPR